MADGVWKGVNLQVFGHSKQLLLNKFFDPSTPSMRKGRDGEKRPAVDRPNADRWNAARSCQFSYYIGMSRLEMGTGTAQ